MQEKLLPLFPLGLVLLPGSPLPLHIFEDRYKEMIGNALRDKSEFGVVQSADQGILNIGCSATVTNVLKHYPDGRMDIVVTGRRRFEIILLDQEEAYLRATVSFFDDDELEEPPSPELRASAMAAFHLLVQSREMEQDAGDPSEDRLSFRIARHLPDTQLRQTLLALRSESARLKEIAEFLPNYISRLRRTAHIQKVAPTNGHGLFAAGHKDGE